MGCVFMVVYYICNMKNDLKRWVLANSTAETWMTMRVALA